MGDRINQYASQHFEQSNRNAIYRTPCIASLTQPLSVNPECTSYTPARVILSYSCLITSIGN